MAQKDRDGPSLLSFRQKSNAQKMQMSIWIASGRPVYGNVFELKQSTKQKYRTIGQHFTGIQTSWQNIIGADGSSPSCFLTIDDLNSYYTSVYRIENIAISKYYEGEGSSWRGCFLRQDCDVAISLKQIKTSVRKAVSKGKNRIDADDLLTMHFKNLPDSFYSHL